MRVGRILMAAGFLIAAASIAYSVVPFHAQIPVKGGFELTSPALRSSCGAPITEAWHAAASGYFAFAPLAEHPSLPAHVGCRVPARHRLRVCVFGLALGLFVALGGAFILRPPRLGWRTHLRPAPE